VVELKQGFSEKNVTRIRYFPIYIVL
jgi:hypothetical protein